MNSKIRNMKLGKFLFLTILLLIPLSTSAVTNIHNLGYIDNNGMTTLDQYEGTKLIIEVFSTECSHCIDFHPRLNEAYNIYSSQLSLISISINPDDTLDTINQFDSEHEVQWDIGLQANDNLEQYNYPGTPTLLMFSPSGILQSCLVGNVEETKLNQEIDNYLGNDNYTNNVEDGVCKSPSLLSQFFNSIYFIIALVIVIYAAFFGIKHLWNRKKNTI